MLQFVDTRIKCGKWLITKAPFQSSVHLKWSCMNLMDSITVISLCQTALSAARCGCFQKYQAVKGSIYCWCLMPHLQVKKKTCVIFSICSLSFCVKLQNQNWITPQIIQFYRFTGAIGPEQPCFFLTFSRINPPRAANELCEVLCDYHHR